MMIPPLDYSNMLVGLSDKPEFRFEEFGLLVASVIRYILNIISKKIMSTTCLVKYNAALDEKELGKEDKYFWFLNFC